MIGGSFWLKGSFNQPKFDEQTQNKAQKTSQIKL